MATGTGNLQVEGFTDLKIRLVTSREAGCVAIGDNNVFKIWRRNSPGPQNALDAYLHVKDLTTCCVATQGIDVEMVRINPERVVNGTLQVDQATLDSVLNGKGFDLTTNIGCLKMEKISEGTSFQLRNKGAKKIFNRDRDITEALDKAVASGLDRTRAKNRWKLELEQAWKANLTDPQGFFNPSSKNRSIIFMDIHYGTTPSGNVKEQMDLLDNYKP